MLMRLRNIMPSLAEDNQNSSYGPRAPSNKQLKKPEDLAMLMRLRNIMLSLAGNNQNSSYVPRAPSNKQLKKPRQIKCTYL